MTKKRKTSIRKTTLNDGFDYTFSHCTPVSETKWRKIKDPKFHALREAYLEARVKLATYIGIPKNYVI